MAIRNTVSLKKLSLDSLLSILEQLDAYEREDRAIVPVGGARPDVAKSGPPRFDSNNTELKRISAEIARLAEEGRGLYQFVYPTPSPSTGPASFWRRLTGSRPGRSEQSAISRPTSADSARRAEEIRTKLAELLRRRMDLEPQMEASASTYKSEPARPPRMIEVSERQVTYRFPAAKVDRTRLVNEIERKRATQNRIDTTREKARAYDKKQREQVAVIRPKLRVELESDPFCPYCGRGLKHQDAHADHIHPVAFGGMSILQNLVFVCADCNMKKGVMTLRQFIRTFSLDEKAVYARLELRGKMI